jgi:RsiW-degrading membrane proteinase PrsW (M82 family)
VNPPARTPAQRKRRRRLGWTIGLSLGLMLLLLLASYGPAAFAAGLALALLPLPIYVRLSLWIDRYEPEPRALLVRAFLWGAGPAVLIALIVNSVGIEIVGAEFGSEVGEIYGGSISAPIVEESAKAAALYGVYRWRRSELDGVLDGIVYAAMVGLGFAVVEDALYYGEEIVGGEVGVGAVFVMRGIASPFAHPVFTAMTGIGLAIAATSPRGPRRWLAPLAGFAAAILLHAAWNTSAIDDTAFVATFIGVMFPVFVALIVVSLVARRRDGRRVVAYLGPEVEHGLLSADELQALATLGGRSRALKAARDAGGREAAKARAELHRVATDLAFLRHRIALGRQDPDVPAPQKDEADLVGRIGQLTGRLPPAPPAPAPPPAGPPPDWYPDPSGRFRLRYWDGYSWTGHTA